MCTVPGISVQRKIFKGVDDKTFARHICPKCKLVLRDAVQPACGHRICQSCADEILAKDTSLCCPKCNEPFEDEDGAYVSRQCALVCSYAWLVEIDIDIDIGF